MIVSKFKIAVIRVVRMIPKSKVVSYGQVALYVGVPRAARQVGWILNQIGDTIPLPWWRVINNEGRISIKGSTFTPEDQREMLLAEKVKVNRDLTLNIDKYRFIPDDSFMAKLELDPIYLAMIADKIPYNKPHYRR